MNQLVLIGGGGHCKSCIDIIEKEGKYNIRAILDNQYIGETVLQYEITGTDDTIGEFISDCEFLITVGQILSPSIRKRLYAAVLQNNGKFATVISPLAHVSSYSKIGAGTIAMHNVVVNANVHIGENCILNTMADVEHDTIVGNNCHISTGAILNGNVKIGDNCFIGSGAVISNGIEICANAVIGAGSVILKSILEPGIYQGNPGRFISEVYE